MLDAAEKACYAVDGNLERVENLKACIKFEQDDTIGLLFYESWHHNAIKSLQIWYVWNSMISLC